MARVNDVENKSDDLMLNDNQKFNLMRLSEEITRLIDSKEIDIPNYLCYSESYRSVCLCYNDSVIELFVARNFDWHRVVMTNHPITRSVISVDQIGRYHDAEFGDLVRQSDL